MDKNPLETIRRLDPEFFDKVSQSRDYTFKDGALPAKVKYLIAMALDAVHGAAGGVASLARQALQHGASKKEIMEALHVASFLGGVGSGLHSLLRFGRNLRIDGPVLSNAGEIPRRVHR